jgi:hypothetical protein
MEAAHQSGLASIRWLAAWQQQRCPDFVPSGMNLHRLGRVEEVGSFGNGVGWIQFASLPARSIPRAPDI